MNKHTVSVLALALASLTSACAAPPAPPRSPSLASAPAPAPAATPAPSPSPSAEGQAGVPAGREPVLGVPYGAERPEGQAGVPAGREPVLGVPYGAERPCAPKDPSAFYGFYRTDAWTTGDVVLTFDDGPHPKLTRPVLDLLAEHRMHATFFVVGRAISRDTYPLVQRMVAEGHTLGSHSYSHDVTMTRVGAPARTVEEIRGQHEATAILVDMALMATTADDFDAMFREVFAHEPATWLEASTIRKEWRTYLTRHRDLLTERGFDAGARPYSVLYSRPPGGGPYVEHDGKAGIALYDEALKELGMINVMWHGASGDTDPERRGDFAFLTENIDRYAERGGVLLIHDYIRIDALRQGLSKMASSDSVRVVSMPEAVARKYGCRSEVLGAKLAADADARILGRGTGGDRAPDASVAMLSRQ